MAILPALDTSLRLAAIDPRDPIVESMDDDLKIKLLRVIRHLNDYVLPFWSTNLRYFTDHGSGHSAQVAANACQLAGLVAKRGTVKAIVGVEAFLLLASAWLHDIGLVRNVDPVTHGKGTDASIRKKHGASAYRAVLDLHPGLGFSTSDTLDRDMVPWIGRICRAHSRSEPIEELDVAACVGYPTRHEIRPRLLAGILSLADAMDLRPERAPDLVGSRLLTLPRTTAEYWLAYPFLRGCGIETSQKGETLQATIAIEAVAWPDSNRQAVCEREVRYVGAMLRAEWTRLDAVHATRDLTFRSVLGITGVEAHVTKHPILGQAKAARTDDSYLPSVVTIVDFGAAGPASELGVLVDRVRARVRETELASNPLMTAGEALWAADRIRLWWRDKGQNNGGLSEERKGAELEMREVAERAFARVDDAQRLVFWVHALRGYNILEIEELCGVSSSEARRIDEVDLIVLWRERVLPCLARALEWASQGLERLRMLDLVTATAQPLSDPHAASLVLAILDAAVAEEDGGKVRVHNGCALCTGQTLASLARATVLLQGAVSPEAVTLRERAVTLIPKLLAWISEGDDVAARHARWRSIGDGKGPRLEDPAYVASLLEGLNAVWRLHVDGEKDVPTAFDMVPRLVGEATQELLKALEEAPPHSWRARVSPSTAAAKRPMLSEDHGDYAAAVLQRTARPLSGPAVAKLLQDPKLDMLRLFAEGDATVSLGMETLLASSYWEHWPGLEQAVEAASKRCLRLLKDDPIWIASEGSWGYNLDRTFKVGLAIARFLDWYWGPDGRVVPGVLFEEPYTGENPPDEKTLQQVAELSSRAWAGAPFFHDYPPDSELASLRECVTDKKGILLVARDSSGRVIAGLWGHPFEKAAENRREEAKQAFPELDGPKVFWAKGLCVALTQRGRGIGRRLVRKGKVFLETQRNYQSILLRTHPEARGAIRIYEAMGFERAGTDTKVVRRHLHEGPQAMRTTAWYRLTLQQQAGETEASS